MNERLSAFVDDLYAEGVAHDAAQPERLLKRRNLEPVTAALLCLILRIAGARRVVEIGTANGFSTLWLADAVGDTDGQLVSVDTATNDDAQSNLARADAAQHAPFLILLSREPALVGVTVAVGKGLYLAWCHDSTHHASRAV